MTIPYDPSTYVVAPPLEDYYFDKDLLVPLADGWATYYYDNDRTVLKPIYMLSGGTAPYTMVVAPNPIYMNANGSPEVNGVPTNVYLYPYDANGNVELYYVTLTSSADVLQGAWPAWPPNVGEGIEPTPTTSDENFIPNGQFVVHNDLPNNGLIPTNGLPATSTPITPTGIYFTTDASSDAMMYVTFTEIEGYALVPDQNPRYFMRAYQDYAGGTPGMRRDIEFRFQNVNRFASDTQTYTFSFWGQTNVGTTQNVTVVVYKNYGTGGSAPSYVTLTPIISLPNAWAQQWISFTFGDNSGATIDTTTNDDYVSVIIRCPITNYDIDVDNVMLLSGTTAVATYPVTTTQQDISRGLAGAIQIPDYYGADLYLPLILTLSGISYDTSQIGKIFYTAYAVPINNELLCNGAGYVTSAYSSIGVPYSRLQKVLFNSTANAPVFGTGPNYSTSFQQTTTAHFMLFNNSAGAVTVSSDTGTSGTTFSTAYTGAHQATGITGALSSATTVTFTITAVGASNQAWSDAGTTGCTFSNVRIGNTLSEDIWNVSFPGTVPPQNSYFVLGNTTTNFYVWYLYNGSGTDPAPGGTAIPVNILSTDVTEIVAIKTMNAIMNVQSTYVTSPAATSINSTYWSFYAYNATLAAAQQYVVWYNVNGGGTAPTVANSILIPVNIASTSVLAGAVATATITAINSYSYAVPNLQGGFIRVWNDGASGDPDATIRYNLGCPVLYGDNIGTYEYDNNISHTHIVNLTNDQGFYEQNTSTFTYQVATTGNAKVRLVSFLYAGGTESRPRNTYLNAVIKY